MENLHLPTINACFNLTAAFFLVLGLVFIKFKKIQAHRLSMTAAFFSSTIFLIGYLIHHYKHGSTRFEGEGTIRTIYFAILISHTILATLVPPMAIVTLYRAWKQDFKRHAKLARWTWPIWMYVSVTGVVVYWMLYGI